MFVLDGVPNRAPLIVDRLWSDDTHTQADFLGSLQITEEVLHIRGRTPRILIEGEQPLRSTRDRF